MSCEDCDNYKPRPAIKYGNGCANYQPKPPVFDAVRCSTSVTSLGASSSWVEIQRNGITWAPLDSDQLQVAEMLAEILTAYYAGDTIEIVNEDPKDGKEYLRKQFYKDADKETK